MTSCHPHATLVHWVVKHGGFFNDDIEVVFTPEKGYHVVVRKNKMVPAETRIAGCPIPCTLSILNARDTDGGFTCHGVTLPPSFLSEQPRETVERFYLMEQYLLKEKSWWTSYIATLPSPEEIREWAFQDSEDLQWIRGTNLEIALNKLTQKWKDHFEEGLEHLSNLNWQSAKTKALTWDLFRWASTIFTSRSFTSSVLTDTLPADRARFGNLSNNHASEFRSSCEDEYNDYEELKTLFSDGFPVLLPVLDILNYRPRAKVEWQARSSLVGLEVLETIEAGQEVCNNYGPRDNEALLLGYFFTIQDNPFDHYTVAIRVPPNSPLAELRNIQKDTSKPERIQSQSLIREELDLKCYVFNADHPRAIDAAYLETSLFSFDLLDSISVLSGNDRELQQMYTSRKTLMKRAHFGNCRNILATLSQLLRECTARNDVLLKTRPDHRIKPSNQKQKFAQIYRESQFSILRFASHLAEYILRRSNGQGTDDEILQLMYENSDFDPNLRSRLEGLLRRHKPITRPGELLSADQLLRELPENLIERICNVFAELNKAKTPRSETESPLFLVILFPPNLNSP